MFSFILHWDWVGRDTSQQEHTNTHRMQPGLTKSNSDHSIDTVLGSRWARVDRQLWFSPGLYGHKDDWEGGAQLPEVVFPKLFFSPQFGNSEKLMRGSD